MRMHLLDGVQVDHCDRHCGTFFDPGELKDAVHPVLDERIWNNDETVVSRRLSKLRSPVDEAWMESIVLDSKPPLTLDRCTNTGGIWLDDGECLKLYDFVLERGQNKDHTLSEERETRGIWSYLFQLFSQLPLEVWNPTRRRPLATYTVLFLIIAIFFLQYLETLTPWSSDERLVRLFGLGPDFIESGAIWQLITYAFLHADFSHLFGNAFMLYLYGDNVEDIMGKDLFLKTLLLSIVAGGLLEFFVSNIGRDIVTIGISAGVAGIMGAYFYLFPRVKIRFVFFFIVWRFPAWAIVAFWVLMQFVGIAKASSNVAYWAHLGGLAAGLAFAVYHGGFKTVTQRIKSQS